MNKVVELVDLLEGKLTQLLLNQEQLEKENRRLKQSEQNLMDKVNQQDLFYRDLEDKYQSLKVANAIVGNKEDKHLTKIKINTLIREIDKCIGQLSR